MVIFITYVYILLGMMAENIKECGEMENNTAKENFITQKIKSGKEVYGTMEKDLDGKITPHQVSLML
jgi:hypothetical protein